MLLACSPITDLSSKNLGSSASYIKFSKVDDFQGWRLITIAPDINAKVQQAVNSFYQ
jgi:hypothetical protein